MLPKRDKKAPPRPGHAVMESRNLNSGNANANGSSPNATTTKENSASKGKENDASSDKGTDPAPVPPPRQTPGDTSSPRALRTAFKTPEGIYDLVSEFWLSSGTQSSVKVPPPKPCKISLLWAHTTFVEEESGDGSAEGKDVVKNSEEGCLCMLYNNETGIQLCDLQNPETEPIFRSKFTAQPTCHDLRRILSSEMEMKNDDDMIPLCSVVIGFKTGDIMVQNLPGDMSTGTRFNIQANNGPGPITTSSVEALKWIPDDPNSFIAAHRDGCVYVYNCTLEDSPISTPVTNPFSVYHSKNTRVNPIARWHVSTSPLYDIEFSPDGKYLAVVGRDGFLRIFDFKDERLIVSYQSYYGGLLCVSWSSDCKYILTGGEDDLVSLWTFSSTADAEPSEFSLAARCSGHQSWVSAVCFDSWCCDGDTGRYRFISGGQDARLCLWDLSPETVHRPRLESIDTRQYVETGKTTSKKKSNSNEPKHVIVPPAGWREATTLEPLVSCWIHNEPLSSVVCASDGIISASDGGTVRVWARPIEMLNGDATAAKEDEKNENVPPSVSETKLEREKSDDFVDYIDVL